ncbi:putative reverse transcriptase domain-containing protein [Tanacetum coccineum]
MDKSWMRTSRTKKQYIDGVEAFIKYAVHNLQKMRNIDPRGNKQQLMMPCPCTTCLNHIEHKVEEVQFHLFKYGIDLSYTKWDKHGEKDEQATTAQIPVNATTEFVDDTDFDMDFGSEIPTDGPATVEMVNATKESFDEDDLAKFQELLLDAEKPLYKGCPDFTKLSAIVKLLNLKGKYGASDKFFTELLGLLKKMLPAGNEMVEKTYQAKKLMRMMGSGYKKIHVCSNNCILYWKDNKELTVCPTCGISRWKVDNKTHKVYENIPAKVMWYFPIIPRLQRLFKLESISKDLRWHATRRIIDGVLRHLADSQAWRTIDEKFPEIAKDPRNLRLGILADGVDVNSGTRHYNVWPVLSIIYNLPPWLCMKRKFIMLLIGVDTYDASIKENFNLRAIVLWTINDYRALVVTLCLLEKFFPLLFFDIMIHLTVHLTREVKLCGPICFRWMYPFERCMKVIKGHVRNKNKPEGCIAEETIAKETIEFFSEYHKTMKTIGIPHDKHVTNENEDGKPLSAGKSSEVSGCLCINITTVRKMVLLIIFKENIPSG